MNSVAHFEAKTGDFSGPMEKLLELIESRNIEISQVSLAAVTGDFISYVEQLGEKLSPVVVSDFVVIASRLLVLKSKILLPTLELTKDEEQDIMDLEKRLRLYREFSARGSSSTGGKTAAQYLAELWDANTMLYGRELFAGMGKGDEERAIFYPPKELSVENISAALSRILEVVSVLMPAQATVRGTVVTLQQKIMELTTRLQSSSGITLSGRMKKEEKEEVIVLFLAVLHMLANHLADVEQSEHFGEMIITQGQQQAADAVGLG